MFGAVLTFSLRSFSDGSVEILCLCFNLVKPDKSQIKKNTDLIPLMILIAPWQIIGVLLKSGSKWDLKR